MSARKPSAGSPQVHREVDRFMNLIGHALILHTEHKRNSQQTEALLKALQGFKENRLREVSLAEIPTDLSREQVLELLSKLLSHDFSVPTWKYCRRTLGICYIGELYRFRWNSSGNPVHQEINRTLRQWGLPSDLDLLEIGWRPAYVDDPVIRQMWNLPIAEVFERNDPYVRPFANPWKPTVQINNIRYVGELLREASTRGPSSDIFKAALNIHTTRISTVSGKEMLTKDVWAAMMVPDDWKAPEQDPPQIAQMQRLEARAKVVREQAASLEGKKRTDLFVRELKKQRMNPYFFRCLLDFPIERIWKRNDIGDVKSLICWRGELGRFEDEWPRGLNEALQFWGKDWSTGKNEYSFYKLLGLSFNDGFKEYMKIVKE